MVSISPTDAAMAPAEFCLLPNASAYSQALALGFFSQTASQSQTRSQTPSQTQTRTQSSSQTQTPSLTISQTPSLTSTLTPVSSWTIIKVAGIAGVASYSGNGGPATLATLSNPCFLAYNSTAGAVIVGEYSSNVVRVISSSGSISAVATALLGPDGVAMSSDGLSVIVAEFNSGRVKSVSPSGVSVTVAGGGALAPDGYPATSVNLGANIAGVTTDTTGGFYVASYSGHIVVYVNSSGIAVRFAGSGVSGFAGDGAAARSAKLYNPQHAIVDASAAGVFICDATNHVVRYVSFATGNISTVAGTGLVGWTGGEKKSRGTPRLCLSTIMHLPLADGGPATSAKLNHPICVAPDGTSGGWFLSDYGANVVRFVNAGGNIMTIAGTGAPGSAGDGGAATSAQLSGPQGIVLVPGSLALYVSDRAISVVRYLCIVCPPSATSTQTRSQSQTQTVTATQTQTVSSAPFNYQIQTFAGRGGTSGTSGWCGRGDLVEYELSSCFPMNDAGDGGPATAAYLNGPQCIVLDGQGGVVIADTIKCVLMAPLLFLTVACTQSPRAPQPRAQKSLRQRDYQQE